MKSQLNNFFFIKKNPIKIKRFFMTIKKSNKNYHKKKCNGTCEVCDCNHNNISHPLEGCPSGGVAKIICHPELVEGTK